EAAGRKYVLGAARSIAAQALWRAGDVAQAATALEEALALAQGIKHLLLEEHVRLYRLEAQLARGDQAAAREEAALLAEIVAKTAHAEAASRLETLNAELALQGGDRDLATRLATPLASAPNRVAAHQALGILARAARDPDVALGHAEAARAIAQGWSAPWHEAADVLLMARAVRSVDQATARTWAGEAAALATDNPYAAAGAGLLLRELGVDAPVPFAAGWQALDLGALRMAWDLKGLEPRAAAAPAAGLDPELFAACMEELALARDEAAIGQAALEGAMALVGATRGYVLSYDEGRLRQVVTVGASFAEVEGGFSNSIAEEVLFSSRPVYVSDASSDPNWREAASVVALNLRTVVCLPLAVPDRILGVLYVDRDDLEPLLGPGDVTLLRAFAVAAAALIVRERDRRAEAVAADLARLCNELGKVLAPTDPAATRAATLAAAVAATGADRGFWLGADGEALAGTAPFDPASVSRGIVEWVASTRQPLGLMDASNTEDWQGRGSVQALGLRTVWCVPAGDAGVVYLDAARMIEADPDDGLRAVEALVGFASGLV
ncbi:MAG: Fis family transcriptional regulator, partial [Cyanobacteria bacterium RYN_339]|nr:Fis family transcriptional regulator [Cyanobacteria bacterium RYN_339]